MALGSLVFLTPQASLVGAAAVLPLGALALSARRVRRTRVLLRLPDPPRAAIAPTVAGLLVFVGLLAAAAAQPALRTQATAVVRTDAQAMFVIDVSRSMLAASGPAGVTRLARAKRDAIALRDAIPEVPSGVATMTDRVLPNLLPNPDTAVFDQTVEQAVAADRPPPENENVVATTLAALGALGTQNYFAPGVRRRLVVVLTDGETRSFDPSGVARALAAGPGIHLVLVHVWASGEQVYDNGRPESAYHESPAGAAALDSLAAATGGRALGEHDLAAGAAAERAAVGVGPTIRAGKAQRTHTLAPWVALSALLPLLLVIRRTVSRKAARQAGGRRVRPAVRLGSAPLDTRST